MRLFSRQQGQPGLPMIERLNQAMRDGRAQLDPFSSAELECVTIDPEFLPREVRGPALQAVSPLLAWVAGQREHGGASPRWSMGAGPASSPQPAGGPAAAALASIAAGLDRRGYLVPGAPPRPAGKVVTEIGGWSVDPDGGPQARPVTIRGDLAIITWGRCQPYWVAEISEPVTPARPLPLGAGWRLVARIYTTYLPSTGLVEFPSRPDGSLPQCLLLFEENVVSALLTLAGIDLDEVRYESHPERADPIPDAPTAAAARDFDRVRCVRVAQPDDDQVAIRTLVVASAKRRHWILDGEQADRALPASVDQIGERIMTAIRPPGGAGG
jgi:hypothetical protein